MATFAEPSGQKAELSGREPVGIQSAEAAFLADTFLAKKVSTSQPLPSIISPTATGGQSDL